MVGRLSLQSAVNGGLLGRGRAAASIACTLRFAARGLLPVGAAKGGWVRWASQGEAQKAEAAEAQVRWSRLASLAGVSCGGWEHACR